jgi:hypothetical protein
MSTRAVYTFKDSDNKKFSIYKHHDGYPSGAVVWIKAGIDKSWCPGRFEADDLAAAFVAANKEGGGGVYLTTSQQAHGDLDYDYVIYNKNNEIWVDAFNHDWKEDGDDYKKTRTRIYRGSFAKYYAENPELYAQAAE